MIKSSIILVVTTLSFALLAQIMMNLDYRVMVAVFGIFAVISACILVICLVEKVDFIEYLKYEKRKM